MAQTGYTPILIYASGTASNVPLAANLTSSASGAELALNYADGKLYFKNSSGVVTLLAGSGGGGPAAGSNTQVQFNNNGVFGASANMTFNGTRLTVADLADSGLTSGRVTYASTGGALVDSAGLTFDGTNLQVGAGTVSTIRTLNVLGSQSIERYGATPQLSIRGGTDSTTGRDVRFNLNQTAFSIAASVIGGTQNNWLAFDFSNPSMNFALDGADGMRLNLTGLGVGTNNPAARVEIFQTSTTVPNLRLRYNSTTYFADFQLAPSGNSIINVPAANGVASGSFAINLNGTSITNRAYSIYANGFHEWNTGTGANLLNLDPAGNLGLAIIPSAWGSPYKAMQVGYAALSNPTGTFDSLNLTANLWNDGTNWRFIESQQANRFSTIDGDWTWQFANGSGGAIASLSTQMLLTAAGNLGIGTNNPTERLTVAGSIAFTGGRGTGFALKYPDWQVYNTAINDLTFNNYTSDLMTLTQAGNLGIGRSNPVSARLDVGADGAGEGTIAQFTRFTTGPGIHGLYVSVNVTDPYVKFQSSGSNVGGFKFLTGNTESASIGSNGQFFMSASSTQGSQRLTVGGDIALQSVVGSPGDAFPSLLFYNNNSSGFTNAGITATVGTTINSGNIIFNTNNSGSYAERMRIAQTGNVGIDETAPSTRLHVSFTSNAVDNVLQIQQKGNNTASGVILAANDNNGAGYNFIRSQTTGGTTHWQISGGVATSTMAFSTGGTERARITSGGKFNVGTTSNGYDSIFTTYATGSYSGGNVNALFVNPTGRGTVRIRSEASEACELFFDTGGGVAWDISCRSVGEGKQMLWFPSAATPSFTNVGTQVMTLTQGGNLTITGALAKGSGSFLIEHPLPALAETHNLVHSFIEAPQADLYYRGKVALVNGKAVVNIDEAAGMTDGTFVLLNREVQCFTSNESDWDAVRGSVSGNILTIECQNASSTATISWMVVGERQDKHMYDTDWTDENGKVIVEPVKPPPIEPPTFNR